jgi:hypothetical protein
VRGPFFGVSAALILLAAAAACRMGSPIAKAGYSPPQELKPADRGYYQDAEKGSATDGHGCSRIKN